MRPKVLIRQFENPLFEFGRDMSSIGFDIVGRIVLPDRRNMNRVALVRHLGNTHAHFRPRKLRQTTSHRHGCCRHTEKRNENGVLPAVVHVGTEYLVIVSSFYLVFSAMFVVNGMLRGAGAVILPMFSTLVSLWAVRIPAAMWLSHLMGEQGIWWAVPFGWGVGLAIVYGYYRSGKWENHSIFAKQKKKVSEA